MRKFILHLFSYIRRGKLIMSYFIHPPSLQANLPYSRELIFIHLVLCCLLQFGFRACVKALQKCSCIHSFLQEVVSKVQELISKQQVEVSMLQVVIFKQQELVSKQQVEVSKQQEYFTKLQELISKVQEVVSKQQVEKPNYCLIFTNC